MSAPIRHEVEPTQYAPGFDGTRNCEVEIGVCMVRVHPRIADDNDAAMDLARRLARAGSALAELDARISALTTERNARIAEITAERDRARARVPPWEPARLLGTGYVRFEREQLWLLNRRERGFGEFGVCLESWDDLFRRYDVRVTGHGADEHGQWFSVESNARSS